jgi:glycosyltransferase involved in cell wall biosynthesis
MKFCLWGAESTAALKGITIGGGELQTALLAKTLAKAGHEVVVIDPFTDKSIVTEDGIKIIHVPGWNKGLPVIKTLFHQFPALYKLFAGQKADFYYARTRSYFHLLSYWAARKTGSKFILALASDLDILSVWKIFKHKDKPSLNIFNYLKLDLPNSIAFKYILKRADYITLQHSGQRIHSTSIKGKQTIFPNIFDYDIIPEVQKEPGDYFISAGSLTMLKGAANLLELVKLIDKKTKIMIVGEPRCRKTRKIYEQLKTMENVVLKGRLKHEETMRMIGNAKALINTSNFEGFPNIFLEAWAQGVPVISLNINPGNVINYHGLGKYCEGDMQKMKEYIDGDITTLIDKRNLISYVRSNHDFRAASQKFLNILNNTDLQLSQDHHEDSFFHRLFSRRRKRA